MADTTHTFDHRINTPEPHIVALLAEIDGIRGEFKSGLRMTPKAITNLKKSTIITSAGASTRIEGANLTDKEVEKVMRGLSVSKFADRDSATPLLRAISMVQLLKVGKIFNWLFASIADRWVFQNCCRTNNAGCQFIFIFDYLTGSRIMLF